MQLIRGSADGPLAVLLPGTASTADFVLRAFGDPLAAFGIGLVSADPPRDGNVQAQLAALADAVATYRPVLVGGVSIGAHLAVRWAASALGGPGAAGKRGPRAWPALREPGTAGEPGAARAGAARAGAARPGAAGERGRHQPEGLLLAMPAWTGDPGPVAAASAATAADVERDGIDAVLARIRAAATPASDWVADELTAAWPRYERTELAATLRATGAAPAPSLAELAAVPVPCGVATLVDDALHPASVAKEWAATAPRAALVETRLAAVGADRATLGRAALLAYLRARA